MLARWTLTNFKSFNSNNEFALASLTLLCGANSTGKSSILQSVLLIRQPLEHSPAEYVIALEQFPTDVNRGGFPRVQFRDSGFMLIKGVGLDGSRAFTGSS